MVNVAGTMCGKRPGRIYSFPPLDGFRGEVSCKRGPDSNSLHKERAEAFAVFKEDCSGKAGST